MSREARSGWRTRSWPRISTLPAVGPHQAGELAYERGLARAVGPEQSEDLAAPHVEADPVGGAHLGRRGRAAPAAGGGIRLDQVTHRAHGVAPCACRCAGVPPVLCAYSRGTSLRGPGRTSPGAHRRPGSGSAVRAASLPERSPAGACSAAARTSISRQNPARIAYRSCSSIWSSLCASSPNRAAYRSSSPSMRCGIRGYIVGQLLQVVRSPAAAPSSAGRTPGPPRRGHRRRW